MARWTSVAALAAALLAAAPAQAQTEELVSSWAKVNVCAGDALGARAQLPGDGSSRSMRVRFTAEWLGPDGWVALDGPSTSPWQDAGSAEFTWGQAGWTFALNVPATGESYDLRAVAEMRLGSGATDTKTTGTCRVGG